MRTPNIECTIACLLRPVILDRLLLLRNFENQATAINVLEAFQGNGSFDSNIPKILIFETQSEPATEIDQSFG